jgi:hypothetical protein
MWSVRPVGCRFRLLESMTTTQALCAGSVGFMFCSLTLQTIDRVPLVLEPVAIRPSQGVYHPGDDVSVTLSSDVCDYFSCVALIRR